VVAMTAIEPRWGRDLRLLENLREQNDRARGSDLFTARRIETDQHDLATLRDADNLSQALLLRFLTQQGELAILGHPDYGSRLYELIGELNTENTRNRAKMFALQALAAEPRVAQVISITVRENPADRGRIDIDAHLLPVDSDTPLNLVFPFFLDGSAG
jgi:phage baseplate assembly protein W